MVGAYALLPVQANTQISAISANNYTSTITLKPHTTTTFSGYFVGVSDVFHAHKLSNTHNVAIKTTLESTS